MGRSKSWAVAPWIGAFVGALLAAQTQTPTPVARDASLRPPAAALPEVVLASCSPELRIDEFGLGDGGLGTAGRGVLRWSDDGCVTAGGVQIAIRAVGVKVTFPSGRELLFAPDGVLHLLFADGQTLRVTLAAHAEERVREVVVGDADRRLQPWRRGAAASEVVRHTPWPGQRLVCCGDGGDLYRPIALGPLLVLERELVAQERADAAPRQRLVVLSTPLVQSLRVMQRQHRDVDARVRAAMTAVGAIADRADMLFPAGASLHRAERDRLRWLLPAGFELEIERTGQMAPLLQLYAGGSPLPLLEWTLRADGAVFLINPHRDDVGKRWHGNGTRLPRVVPELQAREEHFERGRALRTIGRLLD
jgi:hypothetical protein